MASSATARRQRRHGLRVPLRPHIDLAEGGEGARVVGVEPHGHQELRQRLRVAPLQEVDLAQRAVRLGAVGIDRHARLVGGDRGREVGLVDANARQPLVQRVAPQNGPAREAFLEGVGGLGQARLPLEQLPEAVPGQARLRERRNRGPQFPLGLAGPSGLAQHERQREPRAFVAGAQLDRALQFPQRGVVIPGHPRVESAPLLRGHGRIRRGGARHLLDRGVVAGREPRERGSQACGRKERRDTGRLPEEPGALERRCGRQAQVGSRHRHRHRGSQPHEPLQRLPRLVGFAGVAQRLRQAIGDGGVARIETGRDAQARAASAGFPSSV